MKTAWAPWRIEYILGRKEPGCVFCRAQTDRRELTLYQGGETLVVMNKYPYINGHLLAAPVRHVSALSDLSMTEMGVGGRSVSLLLGKKRRKCSGVSVPISVATHAHRLLISAALSFAPGMTRLPTSIHTPFSFSTFSVRRMGSSWPDV